MGPLWNLPLKDSQKELIEIFFLPFCSTTVDCWNVINSEELLWLGQSSRLLLYLTVGKTVALSSSCTVLSAGFPVCISPEHQLSTSWTPDSLQSKCAFRWGFLSPLALLTFGPGVLRYGAVCALQGVLWHPWPHPSSIPGRDDLSVWMLPGMPFPRQVSSRWESPFLLPEHWGVRWLPPSCWLTFLCVRQSMSPVGMNLLHLVKKLKLC